MKFASGFLLASMVSSASLCGDWAQLSAGKCSLANKCCNNQNNTASPPVCSPPLAPDSSSIISQETYRFAGDGTYSVSLLIATGNSCPLAYTSGTVLFIVDTQGTYSVQGNNSELGGEWQKIVYTPKTFVTTVAKSNQANFFTPGELVGSDLLGPCLEMETYLNNPSYGCPCNGTWTTGGISNGTTAPNTRAINVSSCPLVNGTNNSMVSSCPEAFFFNRASRYGSIRVTNDTNTTRLLELTQPMLNQTAGYNSSVVYANYTANHSCPSVLNPTPAAQSSAGSNVASLMLASVLGVAVLF